MRLFIAAISFLACQSAADIAAQTSTAANRTALTLTVYQQDLALIEETRRIEGDLTGNSLVVDDVPRAILPETVLAETGPAGKSRVVEQRVETGLLTPQALLRAAVGGRVELIRTNPATGVETFVPAELLRAEGREAVLRVGGRIRTIDVGRIAFGRRPDGLHAKPKLIVTFDDGNAAESLQLRYLTGGMRWRASYVASLNAAETAIRFAGWTVLTNSTGTAFRDARLRLVSGDVNRATPSARHRGGVEKAQMALRADRGGSADAPAQSTQADLHVFDFSRSISIAGNETRQLALLPVTDVPVTKEYRLHSRASHFNRLHRGTVRDTPTIRFKFTNSQASRLGRGLPGGIIRFYGKRGRGSLLLGGSRIPFTPVGETVFATIGRAIDITSERRQTDFRRDGLPRGVFETAHAVTLRNAKREPVTVTVVETVPGDWKMLSESLPHRRKDSGTAEWHVAVPASGSVELTFRVRVRL